MGDLAGNPQIGSVACVTDTAVQLDSVVGDVFAIKAYSANAAAVQILTDPEAEQGLEIGAGEGTPWMVLVNLNTLYVLGATGDHIGYIVLR